jgi:hypothetical protein
VGKLPRRGHHPRRGITEPFGSARFGGFFHVAETWFRKYKKDWYLQAARHQQKCLGKTKAEADIAYRRWLIEQGGTVPADQFKRLPVAEIAQEFLDDSLANNDARTSEFYRYFLVPFVERFGSARAASFPPLSFRSGSTSTRAGRGAAVTRSWPFAGFSTGR